MPFKDPKKRQEYNREYRKINAERLRPIDAAYRKKHRKQIIAYLKKWKLRNPDYERIWREKNRDKKNNNQRKYVQKHPEKIKVSNATYFTRRTKAGGSFTAQEWKSLCRFYDYRCLCCHKKTKLTPDHIIPVSKGGTSNIENIQPLCLPCNCRKRARIIDYRGQK